jgi:RNA polymerase sigma factor (sigma-70 family)
MIAEEPKPLETPEPRATVVERLFREHNEALLRFLALRLGSQHEAKEVAQEAYVKLLSLESDPAASFLRTFLFTIAANMATDRVRARQRHPFAHSLLFEEFHSELPEPERQLAGEQELGIVQRLIAELPAKCRRAFLLHRINGLSTAAIAAQMGLSERMVRHHILRAVTYCREGLDKATQGGRKGQDND